MIDYQQTPPHAKPKAERKPARDEGIAIVGALILALVGMIAGWLAHMAWVAM